MTLNDKQLPTRRAKGRRAKPEGMNGLERRYADVLIARERAGEIVGWWYERYTIKLGPDARYTPDFAVMLADDTLEFHECKGFRFAKNMVKLRIAAGQTPHVYRLVEWEDKQWKITEIVP